MRTLRPIRRGNKEPGDEAAQAGKSTRARGLPTRCAQAPTRISCFHAVTGQPSRPGISARCAPYAASARPTRSRPTSRSVSGAVSIRTSGRTCADRFSGENRQPPHAREVVDPRDPVASVHAVLARQEAGWLLVFDNAPDRVSVERFVPPAGAGRVLITTQNQHWPPGPAARACVPGVRWRACPWCGL